jgi:hypothetical protein
MCLVRMGRPVVKEEGFTICSCADHPRYCLPHVRYLVGSTYTGEKISLENIVGMNPYIPS